MKRLGLERRTETEDVEIVASLFSLSLRSTLEIPEGKKCTDEYHLFRDFIFLDEKIRLEKSDYET
jgi:hypothetical protein